MLENKIIIKQGRKSKSDLVLIVGDKQVNYTDVAKALLELWNNGNYPNAFIGKLWEICQKQKFDLEFVMQLEIPIQLHQFCKIVFHLYKNEERLYPRHLGKQGGNYLISFLWDVLEAKEITNEILKQYRLIR